MMLNDVSCTQKISSRLKQKYLIIYHSKSKMILISGAYVILAAMNEQQLETHLR